MAIPRMLVDAPAFTSSPYGLLAVVDWRTDGGDHWRNGVTWESRCLGDNMGDTTFADCIAVTGVPTPETKRENVESSSRGATPVTPYVRFRCSPVGLGNAEQISRDALAQAESFQVEHSFWTGLVESTGGTGGHEFFFPHLAADTETLDAQGVTLQEPAVVVDSGSANDVALALGLLEAELANCYNGVGVVHIPVKALPTFVANHLVKPDGGRDGITGRVGQRLRTLNGNVVAVGAGYPGTAPDGTAAGTDQSWIYATGPVFGYRSSVYYTRTRESINRGTNEMDMIAERTYVLGFDCCHVAALVSLGAPVT